MAKKHVKKESKKKPKGGLVSKTLMARAKRFLSKAYGSETIKQLENKINPHDFDFSQLVPDIELTKENAQDWYEKRFTELGIKDSHTRELLLKVLSDAGLLPFPINIIMPHLTFSQFAMPLIRKSFPSNPINSIVGVQPMSAPVGLVHTIRYKYNKP